MMRKTIEANFIDGYLVPLEPCDLNDGDEVLVQVHVANGTTAKPSIERPEIEDTPTETDGQFNDIEPSAPKGHPILAMIERVKTDMPEHLQPEYVPTDAAKNYKHYLYGWPKESD